MGYEGHFFKNSYIYRSKVLKCVHNEQGCESAKKKEKKKEARRLTITIRKARIHLGLRYILAGILSSSDGFNTSCNRLIDMVLARINVLSTVIFTSLHNPMGTWLYGGRTRS
jgi:hypothetical protein